MVKVVDSERVKLVVIFIVTPGTKTENFLPVIDSLLLGRSRKSCIDGVAGIECRIDNCIRLLGGIEPTDIVRRINGIDNLNRFGDRPYGRGLIIVIKNDSLTKIGLCDVRKKVLQGLGIVGQVGPAIGQMRKTSSTMKDLKRKPSCSFF